MNSHLQVFIGLAIALLMGKALSAAIGWWGWTPISWGTYIERLHFMGTALAIHWWVTRSAP